MWDFVHRTENRRACQNCVALLAKLGGQKLDGLFQTRVTARFHRHVIAEIAAVKRGVLWSHGGKGQVDVVEHGSEKRDAQSQKMQWHSILSGLGIDHEAGRIENRLSALEIIQNLGKNFQRRRYETELRYKMQPHRRQNLPIHFNPDVDAIRSLIECVGHDSALVFRNRPFGAIAFVAQTIYVLEVLAFRENLIARVLQRLDNLLFHDGSFHPCATTALPCTRGGRYSRDIRSSASGSR